MADSFTILVGTVGQGMNVSGDSGETWTKKPVIRATVGG